MVTPGRSWQVDSFGIWVEALQESTAYSKSTGAGDGLSDGYPVLLQRRAVLAVCEDGSMLGEVRETCDRQVLFVVFGSYDRFLGLNSTLYVRG